MKKILCMILLAFCPMAEGQIPDTPGWYEIPNTKLRSVAPPPLNTTTGGQFPNLVSAWSGAAFDTTRNRLIIWGGGHNDYYGNEVYALNLNGVPSVERIKDGVVSSFAFDEKAGGCTAPISPLQPQARHTYGFIQYMANVDKMWTFSRAQNCNSKGWMLDFSTLTWEILNPAATSAANTPFITSTFVSDYDPNTGKVFTTDLGKLYTFDPLTGIYTAVGSASGSVVNSSVSMVINPVRRIAYLFGGGNSSKFDISGNGSYNRVSLSTTGSTAIVNGKNPGLAYDPVTDQIVGWAGGDTVYSLNLDTNVWTAHTYPGGPGAAQVNGTYGRWRYSAAAGVFVLINSVDKNAYAFRLNNSADTQAPTAPINLVAIPVSSSQINLSWSASTDNVGVTGYRVERCIGTTCTGFAEIAAPSTANYSDTGLMAATSYSYRFRAVDAAGNLSMYSNIIGSTTQAETPPPPPPPPSTLTVGPGKLYATICAAIGAAQSGNTVAIDAGIYANEACTVNQSNLTIKGVGGYAHMKWETGDSLTNATVIPNGKALLILNGTGNVIESMEFSGAKVTDQNGAGIRYQSGSLTIRNSYFHGNENGLLGQGGPADTLTIEDSVFEQNGVCVSGCGHNVYVGTMGKLVFKHNKSVDSRQGSHTLKSRAHVNEITNSYLSTKNSNGSYEVDLPNGGAVTLTNNVIEQGANTSNSSVVSFGAEGSTNPNPSITATDNILLNHRSAGASFFRVSGAPLIAIQRNTFLGGGTLLSGATSDLSTNRNIPLSW